jgi:hypothetical protein
VLELRYSTNRANLGVDQWVWVPPPQGDAWPRVTFFSNIAAEPPGRPVLWNFGDTITTLDPSCLQGDPELVPNCITDPLQQALLPGTGWRLGGDCLPTDWTERWVRVRIKLIDFGGDEAPELYDPPRSVLIDDFEITFDPGCAP